MKATEIRIGNYVTINNPTHHPKLKDISLCVTGIHKNSNGYVVNLEHINKEPNTYYESYCQKIEFIEPVLLTEKLLLKCGFDRTPNKTYINGSQFNLRIDDRVRLDGIGTMAFDKTGQMVVNSLCRGTYICGAVDCLNELQNLYFTLTGEELEVKL